MTRMQWFLLAVIVVFGGIALTTVVTADGGGNDDDGTSTPYEAACRMLEDGDSAVEAFDILVGLDVPELAASRAVNQATANGCG